MFYILPLNLKKLVKTYFLTLEAPSPQNGQKHSASFADELLECVWPFCGVGTQSWLKCSKVYPCLNLKFVRSTKYKLDDIWFNLRRVEPPKITISRQHHLKSFVCDISLVFFLNISDLRILSKFCFECWANFKQINEFPLLLKSPEKLWFFDQF